MKLLLGNVDYRTHTTDEGNQFQIGLEHAGWKITGMGFDGMTFVPKILETYRPTHVVVHDKRDWDNKSAICFKQGIAFRNVGELARHGELFRACVIKDAGSSVDYHHQFADEIGANALIVYYHPWSCSTVAPWMRDRRMIRTYHSLDMNTANEIGFPKRRKRVLVSGAVSDTYPLRKMVMKNAPNVGIDLVKHPGYGNTMPHTPRYLRTISEYKVHVATASKYGFALRKIIESVAMGATPITDLPAYDVLPEIDQALVRIPTSSSMQDVLEAIGQADQKWNYDERLHYANIARQWYDWRAVGQRLSEALI